MEKGTISKVLDYYYQSPEFGEEVLRAFRKFFNRPKLSAGDKLKLEEEDEGMFNNWFIFDFRLKNKETPLEYFYERNPYNLPSVRLQIYKDLQKNEYGVFEVLEVKIGEGLKLRNLRNEKEYWVRERMATFQLKKGDLVINRIGKVGDHLELIGPEGCSLIGSGKHPFLGSLIVDRKLNPKKVRDFYQEMEKVKNFGFDSLKKKILDGGKCICDFCGKKGKMAAMSYDKKTGEALVVCYNCNLKIMAEKEGTSIEEAKKKRERMFEVGYLFQEVKMQEYLKIKNKKRFDSLEEMNKVLEKIVKAWNDLSIRERKDFEKLNNKKLQEIYKNIKVDFPI